MNTKRENAKSKFVEETKSVFNSDKIHLTEEKETLFITLYAKALDSRSKHSILHDTTANSLLNT